MTILTDAPRQHDYLGDGVTTAFPYTFLIFAATDLRVSQDDVLLTLNTHYTVSGVGQFTGGSVTLVVAPADGSTLKIRSDVPITQGTSFPEGYRFPARAVETAFDRLTVVTRQLADRFRRTLVSAEPASVLDLVLPVPVAHKVLGWNDAATALVNTDQAPVGPAGPQGIQGPPGAGAAPTVGDGTTTVAVPTAITFVGAVVTEPGAGLATVTIPTPSAVPPGAIMPYAGGSAPTGYLLCDGAAVSRATFSALFAAIGVAFGVGDGSTTFNVPDLRSRFPLGAGVGPGLTPRSLAATGGEETHVLTIAEMPAHTHLVPRVATANTGGNPVSTAGAPTSTIPTQSTGGDGAHNTMPPFCTLLYVIKT
jgi:microcystin-dependent protein